MIDVHIDNEQLESVVRSLLRTRLVLWRNPLKCVRQYMTTVVDSRIGIEWSNTSGWNKLALGSLQLTVALFPWMLALPSRNRKVQSKFSWFR